MLIDSAMTSSQNVATFNLLGQWLVGWGLTALSAQIGHFVP